MSDIRATNIRTNRLLKNGSVSSGKRVSPILSRARSNRLPVSFGIPLKENTRPAKLKSVDEKDRSFASSSLAAANGKVSESNIPTKLKRNLCHTKVNRNSIAAAH